MKILVSNDDGYKAAGIHALVRVLKNYGDVTVVAPKFHQSGMSMAISMGKRTIAVKDLGFSEGAHWYYVDGTPTTAVKYAIDELLNTPETRPDIIVSGCNHGSNASTAMWYSGTIGAAREANLTGIPAIAVSLDDMGIDADFSAVEKLFPAVFEQLVKCYPKGQRLIYNVNFPKLPANEIKGIKVCTQGDETWTREFLTPEEAGVTDFPEPEEDETLYVMAGDICPGSNVPEADNVALEEGYIAITPQAFHNTDMAEFERLKDHKFTL